MIYKEFNQTEIFKDKTSITYDYNIDDQDINFCIVKIDGRYPAEKLAYNEVSKEMIFVLDGRGLINVDGKIYKLKKDDIAIVMPQEKYFLEGNLILAVPSTPAWQKEQHHEI